MNLSHDVIVAGGGIAGTCAALHLGRTRRVLLLDAGRALPGAAAGLVNPLMSQRAKPVWRMEEALEAFHATLELARADSIFRPGGVLRPAPNAQQAGYFREAASRLPAHAAWLSTESVSERYRPVHAPHGALVVHSGGAAPFQPLLDALRLAVERQGSEVWQHTDVVGWGESPGAAWVDVDRSGEPERIHAGRVVLALGGGWVNHLELQRLRLHNIKGQTVEVYPPGTLDTGSVPHLAGAGYVVSGAPTLVVGSTYEHNFQDLLPSPQRTQEILSTAGRMLPSLTGATVMTEFAGVRVTVPGTRLPMAGPLPGKERTWVLTGLGSKGLLMAPLLAHRLGHYFDHPDAIPGEIRVRTRSPG